MPRPRKSDYEPCDSVPEGLKWKPGPGGVASRGPRKPLSPWPWVNQQRERDRARRGPAKVTLFSTPGSEYMLERELETGAVTYYKRKGESPASTPKEQIDAEPTRGHQVRYRVGTHCWFIDAGRWFLVKVVKRGGKTIVLEPPETRLDADRVAPWTFGDLLEFPALPSNPLFQRLRPLKDRYR